MRSPYRGGHRRRRAILSVRKCYESVILWDTALEDHCSGGIGLERAYLTGNTMTLKGLV